MIQVTARQSADDEVWQADCLKLVELLIQKNTPGNNSAKTATFGSRPQIPKAVEDE